MKLKYTFIIAIGFLFLGSVATYFFQEHRLMESKKFTSDLINYSVAAMKIQNNIIDNCQAITNEILVCVSSKQTCDASQSAQRLANLMKEKDNLALKSKIIDFQADSLLKEAGIKK